MIKKIVISIFKNSIKTKKVYSNSSVKEDNQTNASQIQKQKVLNNDNNIQYGDVQNEYQYENRNTKGWLLWRFAVWGSIALFSYNIYLVAYDDKSIENKLALQPFYSIAKQANTIYNGIAQTVTQPPVKKFLPDPIHPLLQPKTLVLNLSETLIDTDFVFGKGMILKRRPGLNKLLNKLKHKYQIILFSDDQYDFLMSVLQFLDPRQQIFAGYFGRQCMVYYKGRYIKDLKYLNRDFRNIIVIDKDINNLKKHQENGIILKKFNGQQQDKQLLELLPLLDYLASPKIKDVRKALKQFGIQPHHKYRQIMKKKTQQIKSNQGWFNWLSFLWTNKKKQIILE